MDDLRLEDIGAILSGLGIVALILFGGMALIALWPKIGMFVRALWHRYVIFSWDELMEWMSDQEEHVNTFDGKGQGNTCPVIMASSLDPAPHTDIIPVYTSDDLRRTAAHLTYRERIAVLVAMRDDDKKPYSANKVVSFLGGDRNEILAIVREFRPADEGGAPYTTPIAGRPTVAQFETDPELAYRPPPS